MILFDEWRLLPERIALHEPTATAVLADVHLGYSAARQRLGDAIPGRSVAEELQPLMSAARKHDIRGIIVAGDLFERGFDAAICAEFLTLLRQMRVHLRAVIPGNHDRGIERGQLPLFADGFDLAGWHITHGDRDIANPSAVLGHWHPAVRRQRRKLPCFLARGRHLVLPAFSLDAAGVDVKGDERWRGWSCYAICNSSVVRSPLL